ncbi:MAG: phosphoenolpyruvate--protein phosphotransferase [Desulfuromonadaceae bacterium]|nr:phosphoenolpyruvate--protein phosphotransferase [Desulfuromonadaceae bacterium]
MVLVKINISPDTILVGIGVSSGIGIGQSHLLNRSRMVAIERRLQSEEDVEAEVKTFLAAIAHSKKQLDEIKDRADSSALADHLYIIDTHKLILEDQMLIDETIGWIRQELLNAEGALQRTLNKFNEVFAGIQDEYLRERRSDVASVGDRVLRSLLGITQQALTDIDGKAVVVAHDLSPADTMQIDKQKIVGFVTDVGGRTSHTAILARSLGIPAVVGLEKATSLIPANVPIIIDGDEGTIILNPSQETFREYLDKKQQFGYCEQQLKDSANLAAKTRDGRQVALRANIEILDELGPAQEYGAEGCGLVRSEFLFMNRSVPPDEEEQCAFYREIAIRMAPHPVTIRTLDVGGDKFVADICLQNETNPAMGLRAIRFSLKEQLLFKTQLKAILRASTFGDVRLMFPMISGVAEVRQCRQLLNEVQVELDAKQIAYDPQIQVGIMIETPAAAFIAEQLAKEVDFFSIGTNDLIQYCLAIDRSNEHVAYLYQPLHPAVLRAIKAICDGAAKANISVAMCGEMAGDPVYTLALLGLGVTEFSMNATSIPRVKRILRLATVRDGRRLSRLILKFTTATEVADFLDNEMRSRFPTAF